KAQSRGPNGRGFNVTSAAVIPAGREPGPREPDGEPDPAGAGAPEPEEAALAAGRPKLVELGVALVVIACPLVYLPASASPCLDLKRVVLLAACVLIWRGRPIIDRRLAAVAATWVGILTISSLAGV